jgi:hypothetical protein
MSRLSPFAPPSTRRPTKSAVSPPCSSRCCPRSSLACRPFTLSSARRAATCSPARCGCSVSRSGMWCAPGGRCCRSTRPLHHHRCMIIIMNITRIMLAAEVEARPRATRVCCRWLRFCSCASRCLRHVGQRCDVNHQPPKTNRIFFNHHAFSPHASSFPDRVSNGICFTMFARDMWTYLSQSSLLFMPLVEWNLPSHPPARPRSIRARPRVVRTPRSPTAC